MMKNTPEEIHFLVEEVENNVNRQLESLLFQMQHPEAKKNLIAAKIFTRAMIESLRPKVAPEVRARLQKLEHASQLVQQLPHQVLQQKVAEHLQSKPTAQKPSQPIAKPIQKTSICLILDKTTKKELATAAFDDSLYEVHEPLIDPTSLNIIKACSTYKEKILKLIKKDKREKLFKLVNKIASNYHISIPQDEFWKFRYYLIRNLLRYGIIDAILYDDAITKIVCSGVQDPVKIERNSKLLKTNIVFQSKDQLNRLIKRIAIRTGQKLSIEDPVLDSTFKDFRVQATYGTDYAQPSFTMTRIASR